MKHDGRIVNVFLLLYHKVYGRNEIHHGRYSGTYFYLLIWSIEQYGRNSKEQGMLIRSRYEPVSHPYCLNVGRLSLYYDV